MGKYGKLSAARHLMTIVSPRMDPFATPKKIGEKVYKLKLLLQSNQCLHFHKTY